MARVRGFSIAISQPWESEEERPLGSLLLADPSCAVLERGVHTWDTPHAQSSKGRRHGIEPLSPPMAPWDDRTNHRVGESAWRAMARKRGVLQEEPED